MAWRASGDSNEEMVKTFKSMAIITTKEVENAFLSVPRAAFLPEDLLDEAYSDCPIRGDDHLHMSAPHMYATVLEALELKPGMSFLNIGSGTGYFSMLAGFMINTSGVNHGIELRANLVEHANDCCDEFFMYMPKMRKNICYPQFMAGNCFHIDPVAHKYDRVYCGAACPRNKLEFLLQLVKPGGLVVVPSANKLLKLFKSSSSGDVKETILSDVCFEALVLPDNTELCPKLRFAGMKAKTRKIKVYPPPGLLVSKTSARKSLARLRALQDVVDCLANSRCIPKAFAYVPSFTQISQLTEKSKSGHKSPAHFPVEQTINFFTSKPGDKREISLAKADDDLNNKTEALWNEIQNDTVWENVVNYSYSLCSNSEDQDCLQVYTKVKHKKSKKSSTPELPTSSHSPKNGQCDFLPSRSSPENFKLLANNCDGMNSNVCNLLKGGADESTCVRASLKLPNKDSHSKDLDNCCNTSKEIYTKRETSTNHLNLMEGRTDETSITGENSALKLSQSSGNSHHGKCKKPHHAKTKESGSSPKMDSAISNKCLCPIKVDEYLTEKLAMPPDPNWTSDEDNQLVQLLINSLGCGTSKMSSKSLSKHISIVPSLFSPSVLVRYPKISSYSPESLTYRALALFRVVQVIDYIIPFLCSTSPVLDSVTKPLSERPYPLTSFTDSSFSPTKATLQPQRLPDLTIDKEADMFLTSGVESIRKHKECIQQKIDLHRCLHGQFKEQHSLLKKQIQLIEEQNLMLQSVESQEKLMSSVALEQLYQMQQRVNEQKLKRLELVGKQLELAKERQQNDQETAQLKLQIDRLNREEVRFVQLIDKQKNLKKKLEAAEEGLRRAKEELSKPLNTDKSKSQEDCPRRYNASSILSSLTFLLPLSSRRSGILTELLRATEQPFADQIPVVYVDRRASLSERLSNPKKSVFYQIYEELKSENMNFRWNKRKCDQWWEVKFIGEGIIDQGGGFRDSLAELSDELCPQDANIENILPLFVKSVNQRDQVGEYRDCFVPNPSCKDMKMFHWLGKLMGAAYRSDESLTLSFPPFVWKLLVGEHVTWGTDFAGVDEASVKLINNIEVVTEKEFSEVYANDLGFTTAFSDGSVVEVKDDGNQGGVDYDGRLEYCELVKKRRMMESIDQVKVIREGLLSVIPQSLLELITYQELERSVCGFNEISISLLKESIHYSDELSSDSECVLQLWKVLETFDMEDRSRFLRFVTGRKRLPACITLSQMCGERDTLPSASTCASTLMLPSYSSVEVAEKKLRYAIYNCVAIDTDTNPW